MTFPTRRARVGAKLKRPGRRGGQGISEGIPASRLKAARFIDELLWHTMAMFPWYCEEHRRSLGAGPASLVVTRKRVTKRPKGLFAMVSMSIQWICL